jgi:hypothetical protein
MISQLETAPNPETLRRVAIEPISRVEGHGKVTLLLDEDDHVQQARLHIVEFRGFEKFVQGRPFWEIPVMVQRLCGICPVSHHLAASKAMDQIVAWITSHPTAEKLRRLMHYGQILQSHALHFFHLSSPDLLFGFDSDVARRNIVGVAAEYPDVAKQGVLLRKFGQEVIRLTAGKRVHGTSAIPGGVNKNISKEERDFLLKDIYQIIGWSRDAVHLAAPPVPAEPGPVQRLRPLPRPRPVPHPRRRRHGPLPRRPARPRHGRQDPVRPRGIQPLLGAHPRTGEVLVLHEVPLLPGTGAGGRLVPGWAADPRHPVRFHPHPLRRPRTPGLPGLRRRQRRRARPWATTGRA